MIQPQRLPNIMDCTLRDGSYAVAFQFTAADTKAITAGLDAAGVSLIEIGHGAGLGASRQGFGEAAETDLGYMRAAASVVEKARWGMFCIPGIGTLDDLRQAIDEGMGFVRVGVTYAECHEAEPYIALARRHDLFTCVSLMKSYTLPPSDFGELVAMVEAFGADLVYLVDSAGGMLPEQVADYIRAIRERTQTVRLGFHGHDNLGLGVANSLCALELGVEVVDASLAGLGRGAGNTPIERLVCALIRRGIDCNIDPIALLDLSDRHVVPMEAMRGSPSLDVVSGMALFHSSYMGTIRRFAAKYRVDPRRLIIAVCAVDQLNAPEELVEAKAAELAQAGVRGSWKSLYRHYYGSEQ